MADILGTVAISAYISPLTDSDGYPTHVDTYGKGGLRSVADNDARDAIPAARRSEGMFVYVNSTGTLYTLGSDLSSWTEFSAGSEDTNITDNLSFSANATTSLNDYGFTIQATAGATLAHFDGANARVGIGTDSPTDLFHVAGDIKIDNILKLEPLSATPDLVVGGLYVTDSKIFFGATA